MNPFSSKWFLTAVVTASFTLNIAMISGFLRSKNLESKRVDISASVFFVTISNGKGVSALLRTRMSIGIISNPLGASFAILTVPSTARTYGVECGDRIGVQTEGGDFSFQNLHLGHSLTKFIFSFFFSSFPHTYILTHTPPPHTFYTPLLLSRF